MNPAPLVCMLVLLTLGTGLATAQESKEKEPLDPTGTWVWAQSFGRNETPIELRLSQQDGQLNGTYKTVATQGQGGRRRRGTNEPIAISNAKLDGDEIYFDVVRRFGTREFTTTFSGVISGDEIAGLSIVNFGGEDRESAWMAKRVVTVDDVVGTWKVKLETPQGEIEEAFTLAKTETEPAKLEGTFQSSVFGKHPISEITLEGKTLRFHVEMEGNDVSVKAEYDAKPVGESVSGVIAANVNGQDMDVPFQGYRVAALKEVGTAAQPSEDQEPQTTEEKVTSIIGPSSETVAAASPGRIPTPGEATDEPYRPQPILPGGIVVPLYAPDSPALNQARVREAEKYNMTNGAPGRIQSIVNIHNPSIELHRAPASTNTGTAVILAAGGGHRTLNVGTEAGDFVPFFYNYGVNCVILRNRLRSDGYEPATDAVNDALQAIRLVRAYAAEWGIAPNRIGIVGFSAGAELSGPAAIRFEAFDRENNVTGGKLRGISSRPDFVGLLYPGPTPFTRDPETSIPRNAPPSFVATPGSGDQIHALWAMDYFRAMLRARVPNIELHVYGNGVHAGGLKDRSGTPLGTWQDRYIDWFRDLGFLSDPSVETKAAKDSAAFATQPRPRR